MTESASTSPTIIDRLIGQEPVSSTRSRPERRRIFTPEKGHRSVSTAVPSPAEGTEKGRRPRGSPGARRRSTGTQKEQLELFHPFPLSGIEPALFDEESSRPRRVPRRSSTAIVDLLPVRFRISTSTGTAQGPAEKLRHRMTSLFLAAREERLEDGVASALSRGLVRVIETYGNAGVAALEMILADPHVNDDVAAEALRWLPFVRNDESHKYRLTILKQALSSTAIRVRDAAIVGLASLDDPGALAALEMAIEGERCGELREQMLLVRDQLERTGRATLSKAH